MIPLNDCVVIVLFDSVDVKWVMAHHKGVRTTLALDDDAMAIIQAFSNAHDVSMGKAASELIRRGAKFRLGVRMVNDIPVLDAPADFPVISPGGWNEE